MTITSQQTTIRKLLALLFFSIVFQSTAFSQEKLYDSVAIKLLDKMTSFITHDQYNTVVYQGTNKMQVITESEKGKSGYWYNGEQRVY